ncbi:MAG TPA: HD domain-containing protein [Terracidiphilus sp.]|nr:HD domain-containing protein [Terracidiphilus sp.]
MTELIKAARMFANGSHQRINTFRNPALQSSDVHLKSVAQIVSSVSCDEEVIAAAWLHDVVEDTAATFGDVERNFGVRVANLVDELTVVSYLVRGKRAARFSFEKEHFARVSAAAKTIKLADLIDTCRDLHKSEPASLRRYAREARELADVLEGGEPRLLLRLRRDLEKYALDSLPGDSGAAQSWEPVAMPVTALRVFERAFSAQDIAEPLLSFDSAHPASEAQAAMREAGVGVAGVRKHGALWGYVETAKLGEGTCGADRREFASSQVVSGASSFTDVIEILTRHDWCFISLFGTVVGVISRLEMQKPAVRMWLFGIITVAEMEFTEMVRQTWPDESWTALLSAQRLGKARELRAERERRKEKCQLLECLQLGDKIDILISEPALLANLGIPTASAARRAGKNIESLRNSLAHSQAFVNQDWPQVVRLARRVQLMFQEQ